MTGEEAGGAIFGASFSFASMRPRLGDRGREDVAEQMGGKDARALQ